MFEKITHHKNGFIPARVHFKPVLFRNAWLHDGLVRLLTPYFTPNQKRHIPLPRVTITPPVYEYTPAEATAN